MHQTPDGDYENSQTQARQSRSLSELFPRVDALGFDTRSNTGNPLHDIASPLLGLVIRLEGTEQYDHVEPLYAHVKAMIHGLAPNHGNLHCNESSPIYVLEITEAGKKRRYSSDNNHCSQNANYAGYVPTQAMAQLAHALSSSQAN